MFMGTCHSVKTMQMDGSWHDPMVYADTSLH